MHREYIERIGIAVGDIYEDSAKRQVEVINIEHFADRGDVVIADGDDVRRIDAWKLHVCRYTKVETP